MSSPVNIFWFRRDLRLEDNAGLFHALKAGLPLIPLFIFDRNILDELEDKKDRRVLFIYEQLEEMQQQLISLGSNLIVEYGFPSDVFKRLLKNHSVEKVFTNHDYEPYARQRDAEIGTLLKQEGCDFQSYKDQVIFEKNEVLKDDGKPYTIYTPYSRKWKLRLGSSPIQLYACKKYWSGFHHSDPKSIPPLESIGFQKDPGHPPFPPKKINEQVLQSYESHRDIPSIRGTSRLSVHLRFGTISLRSLFRKAIETNQAFLNELIWREFYQMILWHFPQVVDHAFKPEYDGIKWRNNEKEFEAWCTGRTGYPIVDAGMRELNETGFMHNRLRMITASFLAKHLLVDWRWGEGYFARQLTDYDLASNNGGWQWAAGTGCDAAPYFRIFNPALQTKKFDPELKYIRQWVPELDSFDYPQPIVNHEMARERCLQTYKAALQQKG